MFGIPHSINLIGKQASNIHGTIPPNPNEYNKNYIKTDDKLITPLPQDGFRTTLSQDPFLQAAKEGYLNKFPPPSSYNSIYMKRKDGMTTPVPQPYNEEEARNMLSETEPSETTATNTTDLLQKLYNTETDSTKKTEYGDMLRELSRLELIQTSRELNSQELEKLNLINYKIQEGVAKTATSGPASASTPASPYILIKTPADEMSKPIKPTDINNIITKAKGKTKSKEHKLFKTSWQAIEKNVGIGTSSKSVEDVVKNLVNVMNNTTNAKIHYYLYTIFYNLSQKTMNSGNTTQKELDDLWNNEFK